MRGWTITCWAIASARGGSPQINAAAAVGAIGLRARGTASMGELAGFAPDPYRGSAPPALSTLRGMSESQSVPPGDKAEAASGAEAVGDALRNAVERTLAA